MPSGYSVSQNMTVMFEKLPEDKNPINSMFNLVFKKLQECPQTSNPIETLTEH